MKSSFYTITLFLSLLVLQASFLDILLPHAFAPLLILSAVIIWTLLLGFRQALWYSVPLLLLYELVTLGELHMLGVYGILLSYGVSFLSRRTLIEHQFFIPVFYVAVIVLSALLYHQLLYWFDTRSYFSPSWLQLSWEFVVGIAVFVLTRKVLVAFSEYQERERSDRRLLSRT